MLKDIQIISYLLIFNFYVLSQAAIHGQEVTNRSAMQKELPPLEMRERIIDTFRKNANLCLNNQMDYLKSISDLGKDENVSIVGIKYLNSIEEIVSSLAVKLDLFLAFSPFDRAEKIYDDLSKLPKDNITTINSYIKLRNFCVKWSSNSLKYANDLFNAPITEKEAILQKQLHHYAASDLKKLDEYFRSDAFINSRIPKFETYHLNFVEEIKKLPD